MRKESLYCWKCQKVIGERPMNIGFRAVCIHCDADLHVCKSCRYYQPGKPNDCSVPETDPIADKEQANFCEEYRIKTTLQEHVETDKAHKLFGEAPPQKKSFEDLFNDTKDR